MTRTALLLAAAILAACTAPAVAPEGGAPPADLRPPDATTSFDLSPPPDALAVDAAPSLPCLGDAPPAQAPDPVAFGGKVFAVGGYQTQPLAGAPIALRRRGDDVLLATTATAADGAFAFSVPSHGLPVNAYLVVATNGRPTTREYSAPFVGGESALVVVADAAEVQRWYHDAGAAYDPAQPTLLAAVTDCQRRSLGGTTVDAVPPPAHLVYYDDRALRFTVALAASTNGYALLAGAAPSTAITAHVGADTFPSHAFPALPGELTIAIVAPTR